MRKVLFATACSIAVLTGCTGRRADVPILERYQAMVSQLNSVTTLSSGLGKDVTEMSIAMQSQNVSGVRATTIRLKGDARRFLADASGCQRRVGQLRRPERRHEVAQYFDLLLNSLSFDRLEASHLVAMAELVWHDPLVTQGDDPVRLLRLRDSARRDASMAVSATLRAREWKSEHERAFRYVPVKTAAP